jgi:hypothetical protein
MELDFEIDKITESIENAETGETLDTLVLPVTKADLEEVTKKKAGFLIGNWNFPNLKNKCINLLLSRNLKSYTAWCRLKN